MWMSNHRTHKQIGKCVWLCCVVLFFSCGMVSAGSAKMYHLILGEDGAVVSKLANESYVRQFRAVRFDTKLLAIASPLQVGDTMTLDLLSNVTYAIVIDTITRDQFGSLSILGKIEGAKLSTVSLTANGGAVIGTIQDFDRNRLYRIRCIGSERAHYVLDYDVENMPARQDMPALVPPMAQSRKTEF